MTVLPWASGGRQARRTPAVEGHNAVVGRAPDPRLLIGHHPEPALPPRSEGLGTHEKLYLQ
jgi:hypothetical protein